MSVKIIFEEESDLDNFPTDTAFDLADCCRTCLRLECSLTPTNSSDSHSIKFCDKLAARVSEMMWTKKGEPLFICGKFIEKLRIAYNFQTIPLQTNQTLRRYTNQLQRGANQISCKSVTPDSMATTDSKM